MERSCAVSDSVIPFAPALDAVRKLRNGECVHWGKDLARTRIAGDVLLSVPVEGGASRLKRKGVDPAELNISDHGAWRREHLGAWNAVYGKTPFFQHLYPLIEKVYNEHSHASLAEFNAAMWCVVTDFLGSDAAMNDLERMKGEVPRRFEDIRNELATKVNLNYSIFDALFRLGKNIIFLL